MKTKKQIMIIINNYIKEKISNETEIIKYFIEINKYNQIKKKCTMRKLSYNKKSINIVLQ